MQDFVHQPYHTYGAPNPPQSLLGTMIYVQIQAVIGGSERLENQLGYRSDVDSGQQYLVFGQISARIRDMEA